MPKYCHNNTQKMGLKFYVNVKTEQYWIENSYHFSAFYYFDKISNYNTYERLSKCLSMNNAVKCDIYRSIRVKTNAYLHFSI